MKKLLAEWRNYLEEVQEPTKKLRVLIIGDSQTATIGRHLENKLKGQYFVKRHTRSGFPVDKIYTELQKIKGHYDVAVIFAGGNGVAAPASVNNMLDYLESKRANVIWVGPPPATAITKKRNAEVRFSTIIKNPATHWRDNGTWLRREKNNITIEKATEGRATYVDVRDILVPFPAQRDGIHVAAPWSAKIADNIVGRINKIPVREMPPPPKESAR